MGRSRGLWHYGIMTGYRMGKHPYTLQLNRLKDRHMDPCERCFGLGITNRHSFKSSFSTSLQYRLTLTTENLCNTYGWNISQKFPLALKFDHGFSNLQTATVYASVILSFIIWFKAHTYIWQAEDLVRPLHCIKIKGRILFSWESWRNHVVKCEEMQILGLNVKLKNDESRFSPIMTVMWKEKVLKCDKCVNA